MLNQLIRTEWVERTKAYGKKESARLLEDLAGKKGLTPEINESND